MNRYRVTVTHDHGTARFIVTAGSETAARHIVTTGENCPEGAIKSIRKIKPAYTTAKPKK